MSSLDYKRFAVIGDPIQHSLSPLIHQAFAEQLGHAIDYQKVQVLSDDFNQWVMAFFRQGGMGLNITLPHKSKAYQLTQYHTKFATAAKAVNTVWLDNGKLYGDNTDGRGLVSDLKKCLNLQQLDILILGAGGATKGIIPALLDESPKSISIANRTITKALELKKLFECIQVTTFDEFHQCYDLVINATSIGLLGDAISMPESLWCHAPFCYDLSYSIERQTPFVKLAHDNGCQARDGLGMLVEQAAESYQVWMGIKPEVQPVLDLFKKSFNISS